LKVAQNKSTSVETLDKLTKDKVRDVSLSAKINLEHFHNEK